MTLLIMEMKTVVLLLQYLMAVKTHTCSSGFNYTEANCSSLELTSVPNDLPDSLLILDMSDNALCTLKNHSFSNLINLHTLKLENCSLEMLEKDAFFGLKKLRYLSLSLNILVFESYTEEVFGPLLRLQCLEITEMKSAFVFPALEIDRLVGLQNLTVQLPSDNMFSTGISRLRKLKILNVDVFTNGVIMNKTFQWFSETPIRSLTINGRKVLNYFEDGALLPMRSLKILQIIKPIELSVVDIISKLNPFNSSTMDSIIITDAFKQLPGTVSVTRSSITPLGNICVRNIHLRDNKIRSIAFDTFLGFMYPSCIEHLDLSHNLITRMYFLLNLNHMTSLKTLDISRQNVLSRSKDTITGPIAFPHLPRNLKLINFSYVEMDSISIRDEINFSENNLETVDLAWTTLKSCAIQNLKGLNKLKSLNVSGSRCEYISKSAFCGYKDLQEIVLKNAGLNRSLSDEVSSVLFKDLYYLKSVDLSDNNLNKISEELFVSQKDKLTSLILAHNQFTNIPHVLKSFSSLRRLDLSYNEITFLDVVDRQLLEDHIKKVNTFRLFLGGNPLQCNCSTVDFIEWIYKTEISLVAKNEYQCITGTDMINNISNFVLDLEKYRRSCLTHIWLDIAIIGSALSASALIFTAIMYKHRFSLKYCCLVIKRKYRGYQKLEGDTTNYKYDAFVAYNYEDYRFARFELGKRLENLNMKLCFHHRDFPVAEDITDNIIDAINESRRTIILITKSYLSSTWCEFELEMSKRYMYQQNRSLLIVIFLDEVTAMPKSLKRIWQQITCLEFPRKNTYHQWKDTEYNDDTVETRLFWQKLENAIR